MSKSSIEKQPNKTYKITVTVEKEKLAAEIEKATKHMAIHVKLDGFREGHVPFDIAKEHIDQAKVNEAAVNEIVQAEFAQVVKEYHLNPITNPKIQLVQFEQGKDLVFSIVVVEKPDIEIGDFETKIKALPKKPTPDEALHTLIESSKIAISQTLIDDEVAQMFSNLIDQTSRLGITVEDYLKNQNKTAQTLKEEYSKRAEEGIKAEFLLNELAIKQNIQVSDDEINHTINAAPDEQSRRVLSQEDQKWYIKSVLRKNKVLSDLINIKTEVIKK